MFEKKLYNDKKSSICFFKVLEDSEVHILVREIHVKRVRCSTHGFSVALWANELKMVLLACVFHQLVVAKGLREMGRRHRCEVVGPRVLRVPPLLALHIALLQASSRGVD